MKNLNSSVSSNYLSWTYIAKLQTRASYLSYKYFRLWTLTIFLTSSFLRLEAHNTASRSAHQSYIHIKIDQWIASFHHLLRKLLKPRVILVEQGHGWSGDQQRPCFKENSKEMVDRASSFAMQNRLKSLSSLLCSMTWFQKMAQNIKVPRNCIAVTDLSTNLYSVQTVDYTLWY